MRDVLFQPHLLNTLLHHSHVCLQSSSEHKYQLALLAQLAQRSSFRTEAGQKVMERCWEHWVSVQQQTNIGLPEENMDKFE